MKYFQYLLMAMLLSFGLAGCVEVEYDDDDYEEYEEEDEEYEEEDEYEDD